MNTLTKSFLITLCMLFISSITFARDYQPHSGISLGYNNNYSSAYSGHSNNRNYRHNNHSYVSRYSHKSYSGHKYRQDHNYRDSKYNNHHKRYLSYQHNNYNNNYRKSCRPTSKNIVDRHGYGRKIGGTLCYDHSGQAYIVEGSHYLKH